MDYNQVIWNIYTSVQRFYFLPLKKLKLLFIQIKLIHLLNINYILKYIKI